MPFPYAFPFYFDNVLNASDAGAGDDGVLLELTGAESGIGGETVLNVLAAACASDSGIGRDALIEGLTKSGKGADTGMGNKKEGKISSRRTGMKSRRTNI